MCYLSLQCVFIPEASQFIYDRGCDEAIRQFLANDQILGAIGAVGVVFGIVEVRLRTDGELCTSTCSGHSLSLSLSLSVSLSPSCLVLEWPLVFVLVSVS